MTTRFVPKGFMDTERALIRLASARHPERWNFDSMHEVERQIYEGLGTTYNSELIEAHLRVLVPVKGRPPDLVDRLCDYGDALVDLRAALYAKEILGEFIDENGKPGFIFAEGWGGTAGIDILLKGTAWLDNGDYAVCRLVLFKTSSIEAMIGGGARPTNEPVPSKRISAAKVVAQFKDWRSKHAEPPTYLQDVEYMKQFGVSRDWVRELRRNADTRKRGRPRSKRDQNTAT